MDTTLPSRAGFSFTEIMVVMILTLIITGMILPSVWVRDHGGARKKSCGNHQRQIVLGMNVYANDNDQAWPVFTANSAGLWVPAGHLLMDPTATAIASLEFLAYASGGDITAKLFICPSQPSIRPPTEAATTGTTTSVSAWAVHEPRQIGYSYDWSIPTNGSSIRVVTADRDQQAHKGSVVMAAFADGHVGNLNRRGTSILNQDADKDDIYTADGDGPMNTPGEGSTTRAFVR